MALNGKLIEASKNDNLHKKKIEEYTGNVINESSDNSESQ